MDLRSLWLEHGACATGGNSDSRPAEFRPAFRCELTGRVELARFKNGTPAPCHLLEGLPHDWATRFAPDGSVLALREQVVAGFLYEGRFYTREEAASLV